MGGCIYFICLASVHLEAIRERKKRERKKLDRSQIVENHHTRAAPIEVSLLAKAGDTTV
jgi:NifU-like protein involved in Fe-S cluster formation